jgi:hypothetical protein
MNNKTLPMIKEFEALSTEEKTLLFEAPAIVSVLTLSSFKEITKAQKEDAVKLAHIKTFAEHNLLMPYYEEVDKNFKRNFENCIEKFFPFNADNCMALRKEMNKVHTVIEKLDKLYGGLLRKSLDGYARHVNNAAHNVFQDLIFPVTFSKL